MALRAILFDVDGTLLDTREFIFSAFEHAARTAGAELPAREELALHVGRPLEEIYGRFGSPDRAEALILAHRDFQASNLHLSTAFPGTLDTLAALHAAGLRMAAVTSRSRRTSLLTLEASGLDRYISGVISAEDAPALKPDPRPLSMALAIIGVDAADAAMVGDTEHDIGAGKALGMFTVAATYGFHGHAVVESGPDRVISDIRELPAALGIGLPHEELG